MVKATSARPRGARREVPAKMTSSILPPRRLLAPCSPMTQARASATLDLPEPFGPTMHVMPGSSRSEVAEANDLKPRRVRLFTYTSDGLLWGGGQRPHCTGEEQHRWRTQTQKTSAPPLGSVLAACSVLAVLRRRVERSPRCLQACRHAADHCPVADPRSSTRDPAPGTSVSRSPAPD